MTQLYSRQGAYPAPLPFRIILPNGFTRTDPSTFTPEEIAAAGFTGPYTEPPYDHVTQVLEWVNGSYVVRDLPPPLPPPNWQLFKQFVISNPIINATLASALSGAPAAATALAPTLLACEQGQISDFAAAWAAVLTVAPLSATALAEIVSVAQACHLPAEFIATLIPGGGQT